jgi:hypothetical protein
MVRISAAGPQGGSWIQVSRVDGPGEVRLSRNTFLLRITAGGHPPVERCVIRHLASGREAFVQGGAGLGAFIRSCVLDGVEAMPAELDE